MKIWICWAYSSGKTTIAKDIYVHLDEQDKNWIILDINIERDIAQTLWLDFNNHTKSEKEKFQLNLFNYTSWIHNDLDDFITDNPLHTQLGYTENRELIYKINQIKDNLYDILFFCEPVELENDWVRHTDEAYRKEVYKKIEDAIKDTVANNPDIIAVRLMWDKKERLEQAMYIIKEWKHKKFLKWIFNNL